MVYIYPMKWQVYHFQDILSTNETAKSFPDHAVIIAQRQNGGKGRYGRVWESPVGNLYLSAVVAGLGQQAPLMAFGAGIAVAEALASFGAGLKWPNDVLIAGKKVAGILLEQTEDGKLIIGIGVNVVSCPTTGMLYQATHLNGQITLSDLADKILSGLDSMISELQTNGFEPIRQKWMRLAVGIDQPIRVRLPHQEIGGVFRNLTPQGELVLETPDKTVQISAGDVFLIKG